jgi:VanZ family protein
MHSAAENCPNRFRQLATLARYGTLAVLVAMFVGTHVPMEVSNEIAHHDKLMHFWAYLILAFGIVTTWDLSAGGLRGYQYLLIWLVCAVYGIVDELLQIPVGRSCDAMDWVFDIAGAATALVIFRMVRPLVYRVVLLLPRPIRASD